MNDAATTSNAPKTLRLGGEVHAIHPLDWSDFGKLQSWVDRQFPDPFDVIGRQIEAGRVVVRDGKEAREPYTVQQQQFLLRLATEFAAKGTPQIGTPEADAKVQSVAGMQELLFLVISKGDPHFTRDRAAELFGKLTYADVRTVNAATQLDLVTSDPKAGAGATTAAGPATKPPRRRPRKSTGGRSSTGS